MQRLEVSGAVRPIYGSLGVRRLIRSYWIKLGSGFRHQKIIIVRNAEGYNEIQVHNQRNTTVHTGISSSSCFTGNTEYFVFYTIMNMRRKLHTFLPYFIRYMT